MGKWLLALTILVSGAAMVAADAEAKRIGGARSSGAQRNVTNAPPASTPATPAQQQAAPGAQHAAPAAAGKVGAPVQPAPSGLAKWFPMLGGLALGGMLGWLLATNGGSFLLLALLAIAAVMIGLALTRRRPQGEQAVQYAGGPRETVRMPEPGSAQPAPLAMRAGGNLPAGFDAAGFLRGAKMNFMRLQAANDRGNLEEIREFTTPQLYDELAKDVRERTGAAQQTDVYGLDAELLEVVTENGTHWASVRFSGTVREEAGAQPEPFSEVWNLAKPADGSSGWLLAGIQQTH